MSKEIKDLHKVLDEFNDTNIKLSKALEEYRELAKALNLIESQQMARALEQKVLEDFELYSDLKDILHNLERRTHER